MARSLKKGPFADAHLLKKVDAMNAAGQHQVSGVSCANAFAIITF